MCFFAHVLFLPENAKQMQVKLNVPMWILLAVIDNTVGSHTVYSEMCQHKTDHDWRPLVQSIFRNGRQPLTGRLLEHPYGHRPPVNVIFKCLSRR